MNNPSTPNHPRWPLRLLRRLLNPNYLEELEGDLEERFYEDVQKYGLQKARRRFVWGAMKLLRPALVKKLSGNVRLNPDSYRVGLLKHNLLITLRSFRRYKMSFLINLVGLSSGLVCALLILTWVNDEIKVDKFHQKGSRLFQVMKNVSTRNGIVTTEHTPGRLADALADEIPEIEYAVSVVPPSRFSSKGIVTSTSNNKVKASGLFANEHFFDTFSFHLIRGNKETLFSGRTHVAISEALAIRLFKTTDSVIGKTVHWDHEVVQSDFIVAGIFKEPSRHSTLRFDILLGYDLFLEKNPKLENWGNSDPNTYVVLKEGSNFDELNEKIADFIQGKNPNSRDRIFLQQYSRRYLYNNYENGVQAGGRIAYVRLFSMIALFVLVVASINFMNLSTARASRRLKEIGIKKAFGTTRGSLIVQYLGESILLTFFSALIAILIVIVSLSEFNSITGKQLTFEPEPGQILAICLLVLLTGLISGSYPALYLSGFKPISVLKGRVNPSSGERFVRQVLVVFQFAISAVLILSMAVVYYQVRLVNTKNIGYARDNIIHFEFAETSNQSKASFATELASFLNTLRNIPGVVNASNFRHSILSRQGGTTDVSWLGKLPDEEIVFTDLPVGYDFIETMDIVIAEGRPFSKQFSTDRTPVIFNKTAIKSMGLNDPIGEVVRIWGEDRVVVGVAEDFHFQSLYEKIKPMFFDLSVDNQRVSKIIAKIQAGSEGQTIERIRTFYDEYSNGLPFDFSFIDSDYQALYESENRVAALSQCFAVVAIVISCLGLFGLASFTADRRSKEMSIRKVLGANVAEIVRILTADFTKNVLFAILISLPLSYYIIKSWLDNFAYRIDLNWWLFLITGLFLLMIAFFTVVMQTVKAATANPVDSLKDE